MHPTGTLADEFTEQLLTGVAERLAAAGVALWRPDTRYADDEVGIVLGLPDATPPEQIALVPYGSADDPVTAESVISVQFRIRAYGRRATGLADAVFRELHGLWSVRLGGIDVESISRTTVVPLGTDNNGRDERADNYDLAVHRPGPNRE